MVPRGPPGPPGAFSLVLLAATWLSMVCADLARIYPMSVTEWQFDSKLQLSITSEGSAIPVRYTVIPLTSDLGLNGSPANRRGINMEGTLALVDTSTYTNISGSDVIPYMSCDDAANSYITANAILNSLMGNDPQPQAILLYSEQDQCCGLSGQNLNFQRILTMADPMAALELGNITANAAGTARATISGNITNPDQDQDGQQGGNNSAVAMSILYSITGLITLLFLVIIATGAVRAHRHPERYGPRSALGGRSRQSRAKGLARAVLETIPIVKFGDTQPTKPDPNVELENTPHQPPTTTEAQHEHSQDGSQRHLSSIPESPVNVAHSVEAVGALRASNDMSAPSTGEGNSGANNANAGAGNDEGLGCSICTEDFAIGEDVRVLPCNHKFHPPCVDPWLVDISSTCPLCRLDLRPEGEQGEGAGQPGDVTADAPPLGAEGNEVGDGTTSSRRRSRFLNLARLRHAPVEERLEALRQIRGEQRQADASTSTEEESRIRAKLSDRLRERFRVRTRTAQQVSDQRGRSAGTTPTGHSS